MYAVVSSGGKQYRVEAGQLTLSARAAAGEPGASVTFDRVLLIGDGDEVTVGTPSVPGASVSATVLGEALGPKLVIFKFKQKVKYRRRNGHRQHLTQVRIDAIRHRHADRGEPPSRRATAKAEGGCRRRRRRQPAAKPKAKRAPRAKKEAQKRSRSRGQPTKAKE